MKLFYDFLMNSLYVNIATFLGLIITGFGFGFTIYFTHKSREAAVNAENAVDSFRKDLQKIDTISDLTQAISNIDEIKRLQRLLAWQFLPDRYSHLKKNLIQIKNTYPNISPEQRARVVGAIRQLSRIEEMIDRYLEDNTEELKFSDFNTVLSSEIESMLDLLSEIQLSQGK